MQDFHQFSWTSRSPGNIAEKKRMNRFSWKFQDRSSGTQGTIANILGVLCLTPWIQQLFVYFLSLDFSNITERLVKGFLWNYQDMSDITKQKNYYTVLRIARLYHVPQTSGGGMSVCNISEKWIDFHDLFRISPILHEEQSEAFLGMLHSTSWLHEFPFFIQDLFSIIGSVFVNNIMDREWIFTTFPEYVGHVTRNIGLTVSHLIRAPQIRRDGVFALSGCFLFKCVSLHYNLW